MVPKRGLEPPHPDGYYTLNVARLPIPPLRRRFVTQAGLECSSIEHSAGNDSILPFRWNPVKDG